MVFYVSYIKCCIFVFLIFILLQGVDKYKPTSLGQIVGQQTDKSPMKRLIYFLTNWNTWHTKPTTNKKKKTEPISSTDPSQFKAVLLTGPPGVGKLKDFSIRK